VRLQADAYSGFHHLYGDGFIYEVACWAHTRRKFHDIHVAHPSPTTTEALARIGALYGIEEQIRGNRQNFAARSGRPCQTAAQRVAPVDGEDASLALNQERDSRCIRYALSHWRALTRYVVEGLLEIDNNSARERCVPLQSAGRLPVYGAEFGGQRAASL